MDGYLFSSTFFESIEYSILGNKGSRTIYPDKTIIIRHQCMKYTPLCDISFLGSPAPQGIFSDVSGSVRLGQIRICNVLPLSLSWCNDLNHEVSITRTVSNCSRLPCREWSLPRRLSHHVFSPNCKIRCSQSQPFVIKLHVPYC